MSDSMKLSLTGLSAVFCVLVISYFHTPWHLYVLLDRLMNLSELSGEITDKSDYFAGVSDPDELRNLVDDYIEYYHDFPLTGRACHLQSAEEALISRRGDCKTRAILLLALLQARNIPATLGISMEHWWVDYEGKTFNPWQEVHESDKDSIISEGMSVAERLRAVFRVLRRSSKLWMDLVYLHMPPLQRWLLTGVISFYLGAAVASCRYKAHQ